MIGLNHPLVERLVNIEMAPCLTLMATFHHDQPVPFISHRDPDEALSWIAYNSGKRGRSGPGCWVAQANIPWSVKHLELSLEEIADRMLPLLCDRIGTPRCSVRYAAAHRWRFANVVTPLGEPFVRDETGSLYLGGDWCLGPRVEAAWISGRAIADDILIK
jgi:predicted NAD/FAD-dependent oxidoreductase